MNSPFIFFKNNLKSKSSLINLLRKHIPLNDERLNLIKEKNQIDKDLIRKTEIKIASNGLIEEIQIKANELFEEINFKLDQPQDKKYKFEYLNQKLNEISNLGENLKTLITELKPNLTSKDYVELYESFSKEKVEINITNPDNIITYDDYETEILKFAENFPPLLFKRDKF